MSVPATKEDVLELAKVSRDSAREQNEVISTMSWELTKLSFWVAVLQKSHPDRDLMKRASAAVAQANDIDNRIEAREALFGRLSENLLTG
jgi:hypothetical protein